jgi:uncharacterized SAM-binding protein YcdF (DUF218 family)
VGFLIALVKEHSRLQSLPFMFGVFGAGVALLYWRRSASMGRRWLTAAVIGYWLLSTPMGSWLVSAPLARGAPRLESAEQAAGAQAVVVLGGGIVRYIADGRAIDDLNGSALRVIEAARVYKLLGDPLVIVSGGDTEHLDPPRPEAAAFREAIVRLGVPASRVVVEDQSHTTREEAVILESMLAARHIERFVLVTTPAHMLRSLATFRRVGLNPIPSASRRRSAQHDRFWTLWPDRESLSGSDDALYAYVSWLYYRLRGWM